MASQLIVTLLAAVLCLGSGGALAAAQFKIVTASARGTYIQIGRDIAKFVAPDADIELEVLPSAGSAENVQRMRYEPGVKFAMVQSDVYQAFLDEAASGNTEAGAMIRPLRVIIPLYNEEIYFVARSDSTLNFVHDIKDAKLNVGPLRSGTAMSATTIYRQMFGAPVADANLSFLTNEEALVKLISDKSLDVVVMVAGQPFKLLVDMKPEARQLIKLLKFDPNHPASAAALKTYFPATVRATSYPNLLQEDLPSVAVKAFLVTFDYTRDPTVGHLSKFARSLCQNFARLQTEGHPKWREVELALPELGRGWSYYQPMARQLRSCIANRPAVKPVTACAQQERILGLCK
ncbi:TAXI family TRAP transporter solute-binding subunit [Piscinibacter sp.]|jgi:TRAP transporter TAXI family solute receptor|uniref:TAXI family TRAP transporter solute-binding subunit n=1 Tax=Piscinibacter sp. TaxID=1903157 RepID=UPI00355A56AB